jgi:hypothetical protein
MGWVNRHVKDGQGLCRGDDGSVMLEAVFAFPLILALIFGSAQIAHIWAARQVVEYSAYCAARAAVSAADDQNEMQEAGRIAAEQVCSWICIGQAEGESPTAIAGWGNIKGSGAVGRKTKVTIRMIDDWNVEATVVFDFALITPIAGPIMGWGVNPWADDGTRWGEQHADLSGNQHRTQDTVPYPHLRFTESVRMSKPAKTTVKMW